MNKTTIAWCHGIKAPVPGSLRTVERQGYTWNPTRGCSAVSSGCLNCYAGTSAIRFSGPGLYAEGYAKRHRTGRGGAAWTGKVNLLPEKLADPLKVRKPGAIFVNSMSDLFHEALTFEEIAAVVGVIAECPQHLFISLTKRAKRMREWFEWIKKFEGFAGSEVRECWLQAGARLDTPRLQLQMRAAMEWPIKNWRIGVSAEDQQRWDERVPELLRCPAVFRFVSAEPLLGPVDIKEIALGFDAGCPGLCSCGHVHGFTRCPNYGSVAGACSDPRCRCELYSRPQGSQDGDRGGGSDVAGKGLHQVIVGPESGHGARPMDMDWARSIRDQCQAAGCAFFMKQVVTPKGKKLGIEHFPEDLKIQESSP